MAQPKKAYNSRGNVNVTFGRPAPCASTSTSSSSAPCTSSSSSEERDDGPRDKPFQFTEAPEGSLPPFVRLTLTDKSVRTVPTAGLLLVQLRPLKTAAYQATAHMGNQAYSYDITEECYLTLNKILNEQYDWYILHETELLAFKLGDKA